LTPIKEKEMANVISFYSDELLSAFLKLGRVTHIVEVRSD